MQNRSFPERNLAEYLRRCGVDGRWQEGGLEAGHVGGGDAELETISVDCAILNRFLNP